MNSKRRENTVGFVGLGAMGRPMAEHILKAGHRLVIYDIDPAKSERLVALGAQIASGPADIARYASIMISMVETTEQAEDVILGVNGFIATAQAGDIVVTMSTIEPHAVQQMHETLSTKGIEMIDVPVSGMVIGAENGSLIAFVGGNIVAVDRFRPVLEAMTSKIHYIGPVGQGIMMKLVNNVLAQAGRVLVIEALAMGAKGGLDIQTMMNVISTSSGDSAVFRQTADKLISRDFTGIRMDITIKDMELETQIGKYLQVPMFMANNAQQIYQMAKAAGLGDEHPAAIVKVYERFLGVSLVPSQA